MFSDRSTLASSFDKEGPLLDLPTSGTHKVKYSSESTWDFHLDIQSKPVDLSLILPHYRARHQPVDHRMSMFIGNESGPIKLKICRNFPRSRFYLEVQGETSDVTIWLPSDFKGQIHCSGRPNFSSGFVNRIMRQVRLNEPSSPENCEEDDVIVYTRGAVSFRMWDVQTCAPENCHKESFRRMFSCTRKQPETVIDWDFLLKD